MKPAAAVHVVSSIAGTTLVAQSLPPAFGGLEPHNDSTLVSAEPLTVGGTVPVGGYLASLKRTARAATDGTEALQVRFRVREGAAGVGLLDASRERFLDIVDGFKPDAEISVTFLIRGMHGVGPLVFRSAGQGRVVVELLGVDSFALKSAAELVDAHVFPEELTPFAGWSRYYGRFGATPVEALRQLLFEELHEPLVMRWRNNLQVVITPEEETSRVLFVSGMYEPSSTLTIERYLSPGAVMIDVGANVGVFTLIASRRVGATGHVYSFEPSSRERATLEKNLMLNGCTNVTVIAAAVSDRGGATTLKVAAGRHRGLNTLAPSFAYAGVHMEREEVVSLVTLDDLWRARSLRAPDLLKIDAEGAELQVLEGAAVLLRDSMPVILFEVNDTALEASGASRAALEQWLTSFGYRLYRLDDATAAMLPVATMAGVESENFVAVPPDEAR